MEDFEVIQLFTGTLELDGLAGDRQHREGCAAAGIAVGLGEDDAVDADRFVEGLGDVHGILTGHGVHDQQSLVHGDSLFDLDQFLHQHFVDLQAACGIEDDDVIAVVLGVGQCLFGDGRRLFAGQGEDRRTGLFAHHLQLVDRGRTVDVAGHQHRAAALLDVVFCKLCCVGRLTVALQAAEHDDGLALVLDDQTRRFLAAHQGDQLLVDDLDDLLGRGQALHDLLAHGALGDLCAEILRHFVVDVGFQQGHPDLAHGGFDVRLAQFAVAAQLFEHTGKAVGQRFKCHCSVLLSNQFSALIHFVDGADEPQHLVQSGGILGGGQPGVRAGAFKPGVDDQLLQLFQRLLHPAVPGRETDLFFQLPEGCFAMLDGVPRPLPGDAEVFSDLAEGEVIVVILAQHLALFGREHFAVKIEQIAHFKVFCHVLSCSDLRCL